ncbi:MAG: NAD(P)-dependent oxidoreductase [Acholeplasmataceae bacterium]|nr:NAD(P)-dependent oxidoreductase [Acholeplasmataceae bacterium]
MNIFIPKRIHEQIKDELDKSWNVVHELDKEVEVFVGMASQINKNLEKLKNLKYILLITAGYDTLDISYLSKHGIRLTNAKDVYSVSIAEMVVAQILNFNKGFETYHYQQEYHIWKSYFNFRDLHGAKVGFIGGGSIAVEILKRLKGFNVTSSVYRRSNEPSLFDETYNTIKGLQKLMAESDYIINSLPLSETTTNLIDKSMFDLMHQDVFYVNVGRGQTHDESYLIKLLKNNKIRGAYLDVFQTEPLEESSPYWAIKNLLITPHNSANTPLPDKILMKLIVNNLNSYLTKNPLINEVKL